MPLNLPFHPSSGRRTSNWTDDFVVGVAIPFTLQCAGTVPLASITTAPVMLAFGRERSTRSEHVAADADALKTVASAIAKTDLKQKPVRLLTIGLDLYIG